MLDSKKRYCQKIISLMLVVSLLSGCTFSAGVPSIETPKTNAASASGGGGMADASTVNLASGDVSFPVTLASLPGRNGLDYTLTANYSTTGIDKMVDRWNLEAPTGVMGLGWSLPQNKIVRDTKGTGTSFDDTYYLKDESGMHRLIRVGNTNGAINYKTDKKYNNWTITFQNFKWIITKDDGMKYIFGGIRNMHSVENGITWGNWVGSSVRTGGQSQIQTAWNLSSIENTWGDSIDFEYMKLEERVGKGMQTYTQSSYLKEITGSFGDKIIFDYIDKKAFEFQDPHNEAPEPDAYQERYESKYLDQISILNEDGKMFSTMKFEYGFLGKDQLAKRVLKSITQLNHEGKRIAPVQKIEYWGESSDDGVSVSLEKNKDMFNAKLGALYGAIKTVTTPEGGTISYNYAQKTIKNSKRDFKIDRPDANWSDPKVFFGQDYTVISWKGSGPEKDKVHISVYQWTGKWEKFVDSEKNGIYKFENSKYDTFNVQTRGDFFYLPSLSYVYNKDPNNNGKWNVHKTYLASGAVLGDSFIAANSPTTLFIKTFNGQKWEFEEHKISGGGEENYAIGAFGNHIFTVTVNQKYKVPTVLNLFYLDENKKWKKTSKAFQLYPRGSAIGKVIPAVLTGKNFALVYTKPDGNKQIGGQFAFTWDNNYQINNYYPNRNDLSAFIGCDVNSNIIMASDGNSIIMNNAGSTGKAKQKDVYRFNGQYWTKSTFGNDSFNNNFYGIDSFSWTLNGNAQYTEFNPNNGDTQENWICNDPHLPGCYWPDTKIPLKCQPFTLNNKSWLDKMPAYVDGNPTLWEKIWNEVDSIWTLLSFSSIPVSLSLAFIPGMNVVSFVFDAGIFLGDAVDFVGNLVVKGLHVEGSSVSSYQGYFTGNNEVFYRNPNGLWGNNKAEQKSSVGVLVEEYTDRHIDDPKDCKGKVACVVTETKKLDKQNTQTAFAFIAYTTHLSRVMTYGPLMKQHKETLLDEYSSMVRLLKNGQFYGDPKELAGSFRRDKTDTSMMVGPTSFITYSKPAKTLKDATSLTLYQVIDDGISGELEDYVVSRVSVNDGYQTTYAHIEYDETSASFDATGVTAQYEKVTVIPSSNSKTVNKDQGYTDHYFIGDEIPPAYEGNEIVSYVPETEKGNLQLLKGAPYQTITYSNDDGKFNEVSSSHIFYTIFEKENKENQKAYYVRSNKVIGKVDGVETSASMDYDSIGRVSKKVSSNYDTSGQEESIETDYTYASEIEVYSENLKALNIISPVVQTIQKRNGVVVGNSVTTWKDWGKTWAPSESYFAINNNPKSFNWQQPREQSDWVKKTEISSREENGVVTETKDIDGMISSTLFDTTFRLPIASFSNASLENNEAGYYVEKYKDSSRWVWGGAAVLDQEILDDTFHFDHKSKEIGQSFTAGRSGSLTQVDLKSEIAQSITLEILEGDGLEGKILSAQKLKLEIGWNKIALNSKPNININERYTIHIKSDEIIAAETLFKIYKKGNFWTKKDRKIEEVALIFRTYVNTGDPSKISLQPKTLNPRADNPKYIASAWVKPTESEACVISFGDRKTQTKGNDLQYIEVTKEAPFEGIVPKVECPKEGSIDDFRFAPVDSAFSATVYTDDFHLPIKKFSTNGGVQTIQYDEFYRPQQTTGPIPNRIVEYEYYYSRDNNNDVFSANDPNYKKVVVNPSDPNSQTTVSYTDGVGSVIQEQTSKTADMIIVSANLYNQTGRMAGRTKPAEFKTDFAYMPDFVETIDWTSANTGLTGRVSEFYPEDQGYPFRQIKFENSPLSRVIAKVLPGKDYQDAKRIANYSYSTNEKTKKTLLNSVDIIDNYNEYSVQNNSIPAANGEKANSFAVKSLEGVAVVSKTGNDHFSSIKHKHNLDGSFGTTTYSPNSFVDGKITESFEVVKKYDYLANLYEAKTPDIDNPAYNKYDRAGRLRFAQDANKNISYRKYDLYNRIVEEGEYRGNWKDIADEELNDQNFPSKNTIKRAAFVYDVDDQNNSKNLKGRLFKTTTFDNQGNIITEEEHAYDVVGNITSKTEKFDGNVYTTKYAYDSFNRLSKVTYPSSDSAIVTYSHNSLGKITGIGNEDDVDYYASYTYNPDGRLKTETLGSADVKNTRNYKYDSAGFLVEIEDDGAFFSEELSYEDAQGNYLGGNIAKTEYKFNSKKFKNANKPKDYEYEYSYDYLGQLIRADSNDDEYDVNSIEYDANGDILTLERNKKVNKYEYYQNTNRLKNINKEGEDEFAYDGNGSISKTGKLSEIVYDVYTGMTLEISKNASEIEDYQYNARNERISKVSSKDGKVQEKVTYVRGAGSHPLVEKTKDNSETLYVYGPNGLIGMNVKDDNYFFAKDYLGSNRVVFDQEGEVKAHFNYMPFGNLIESSSSSEEDAQQFRYRYTGQEYDGGTGLYNYHARIYDSEIGRFYSIDPKEQYFSPYVYVGNNPVNIVDPTGQAGVLGAIIGGVVGAIVGGLVGSGAGAGIGALIGGETSNWDNGKTGMGAAIGAGVGAGLGAVVGLVVGALIGKSLCGDASVAPALNMSEETDIEMKLRNGTRISEITEDKKFIRFHNDGGLESELSKLGYKMEFTPKDLNKAAFAHTKNGFDKLAKLSKDAGNDFSPFVSVFEIKESPLRTVAMLQVSTTDEDMQGLLSGARYMSAFSDDGNFIHVGQTTGDGKYAIEWLYQGTLENFEGSQRIPNPLRGKQMIGIDL